MTLPSTINTATTERRVRRAFRKWWWHGHTGNLNFETHFEHGHWWVVIHLPRRGESQTFDAVDAVGGDAQHGFSFEEV